jgi:two-component system NarL family response regulator
MIVDDSAAARAVMRDMLASLRCEITECQDGWEAIREYKKERPDWVLMDIHMPGLDGITAAAALCREDPSARILMVTHFNDDSTRDKAIQVGAAGFFSKEDLYSVLQFLRSKNTGGAG